MTIPNWNVCVCSANRLSNRFLCFLTDAYVTLCPDKLQLHQDNTSINALTVSCVSLKHGGDARRQAITPGELDQDKHMLTEGCYCCYLILVLCFKCLLFNMCFDLLFYKQLDRSDAELRNLKMPLNPDCSSCRF